MEEIGLDWLPFLLSGLVFASFFFYVLEGIQLVLGIRSWYVLGPLELLCRACEASKADNLPITNQQQPKIKHAKTKSKTNDRGCDALVSKAYRTQITNQQQPNKHSCINLNYNRSWTASLGEPVRKCKKGAKRSLLCQEYRFSQSVQVSHLHLTQGRTRLLFGINGRVQEYKNHILFD